MARQPVSYSPVAQHTKNTEQIQNRGHNTNVSNDAIICDVLIIGGGIAGLSLALNLAPELHAVLVTKNALGESNTRYAQGGLAAPVGLDDDPDLHLRDTLAAGAGLVDEAATHILVNEAREAVSWLIKTGTRFDEQGQAKEQQQQSSQDPEAALDAHDPVDELATRYDLAREAAHSRRRVLHAQGDATGAEIERALVQAVRQRPRMHVLENTLALELLLSDDVCTGVALLQAGTRLTVQAQRAVVLANGGAGRLWKRTSNPTGATADGLALAWRAGAALADLEFVQFHPTVLVPPTESDEAFLVSEAVRGEGAHLRNAAGERFMPRYHADAELAPRDVVARAILSELLADGAPSVFLDLRHVPESEVRQRFPTIGAVCQRYGLDLAHDLIPVAPAAHYFMGGVAVDTWARTTVPHLYAVGEVACTGVHGANRLASNSLLEGLVFGRRAARTISGSSTNATALPDNSHWPQTPVLPGKPLTLDDVVTPEVWLDAPVAEEVRAALQTIMWEYVSLRRTAQGLATAQAELRRLAQTGPVDPETANMLFAAQAIAACALARTESRGGHYRDDYPTSGPGYAGLHTLVLPPQTVATVTRSFTEGQVNYARV